MFQLRSVHVGAGKNSTLSTMLVIPHVASLQVKEARDIAREAALVLHDLIQYVQQGGQADGWHAWTMQHASYAREYECIRELQRLATSCAHSHLTTDDVQLPQQHRLGDRHA